MRLYNTLTRNVQLFQPLEANTVRFYSCGPTVYDHAHIGNLRAYIFADTLQRTLEANGYKVKRIMNYTDIDDKTVARSHQKYPDDEPMVALKKLTKEYIDLFHADMRQIGNRTDNMTFMAATAYIEPMQELITRLYTEGFAYIADDGVYFSIDTYKKSGKTYGQLLTITAASTSEARIHNDEYDKESVHDFALWKTQKPGEPAWPFTIDGQDVAGRPGWHIECSAMSHEGLGQPFDLHTGGVDNIFPHHENEIAQSTAGQENPVMARFFAHNEHLLVEGKKMSKSAKNFYTLENIVSEGYDPLAFRLLILQGHYRSQINFSFKNLQAAQNRLQSYRAFADLLWQLTESSQAEQPLLAEARHDILAALKEDLDTPTALARLSELETQWLQVLGAADKTSFKHFLLFLDDTLGLRLVETTDLTESQYKLLKDMDEARSVGGWETADRLRNILAEQGIGIRNIRDRKTSVWFRKH